MTPSLIRNESRPLHVLTLTSDDRLSDDVAHVCADRGILASQLHMLGSLPKAIQSDSSADIVLLIDAGASLPEALRTAATVSRLHSRIAIVIAVDGPRTRSQKGFRLVDRWRTAERIVDELELAHIGIPAFVNDPLYELGAARPAQAP
jgi:hypothetical protein